MLPDAPMPTAEPAPRRGTVESFRLLTARLKRETAPATPASVPQPVPPALPEPEVATVVEAPLPPVPRQPASPHEAAAALLDIIWGALDLPPQERSMAGDTLLLLLPSLSAEDHAMLAERVAAMESPPPLLLSRLLGDPRAEVGGVVLERSAQIAPEELLAACRAADPERLRLLARRRSVPAAVSAEVVARGDLLSLLALLRNPGAELSFAAFLRLSQMTAEHPSLQAPLALRADLPLAVALDLLWRLPAELRRVVMARFLSDSVTLSRILALALGAGDMPMLAGEPVAPDEVEQALEPLLAGRRDRAVDHLAALTGLDPRTLARILGDEQGEAIVVLLKALGLGRGRFDSLLDRIRAGTGLLREDRPQAELKAVFDALSFTKARVVLVYWDWFTWGKGPYAAADGGAGLVEGGALA